ncbi:MAG: hypothetical protein P5684_06930 [Limnospira sp. PMC 1238.20]|nr:hypothetical protein [Limnospira sp. PMC 1238.20]
MSFLVSHQDLAKKPGFLSIFLGGVQPQNSDNNPIIIGATHHQTLPREGIGGGEKPGFYRAFWLITKIWLKNPVF